MDNWLRLFLSPNGYIGRRTFWHGWLVLTALNLALLFLGTALMSSNATRSGALALVTLYPTVCLYAKRLHGLGKSGWLQAPSRIIWTLCLVTIVAPLPFANQNLVLVALYGLGVLATIWDAVLLWWSATGDGAPAGEPAAVFD